MKKRTADSTINDTIKQINKMIDPTKGENELCHTI